MRYLPHTDVEIRDMLAKIGVSSVDDLFNVVPDAYRLKGALEMEPALDELRLMDHLTLLSRKNQVADRLSFLGGGMYDHHIPPAVDQLLLRSEFYTSYTPYQAEVAQGTLQAMFEFQTMVSELFGLEVANASMYDGASAMAEAVLMSRRITGRGHSVVSGGVHPHYLETVRTYLHGIESGPRGPNASGGTDKASHLEVATVGNDGQTSLDVVRKLVRKDTASIVVGYPNFFGCVEDVRALREICDSVKALLIVVTTEPYALALLQSPGELGADIAVGEGQSLAVSPQFGGPGLGLFACRNAHVRQMPGRLVGETVDASGKRGFVLTLSTREQHIRRERATSNICTNHGLIALAFTIRLAMLGRRGFDHAARLCFSRAEYLKKQLVTGGKFTLPHSAPTFNEFVVRCKEGNAKDKINALSQRGVDAGIPLERWYRDRPQDFLVAVTERHDKSHMDRLVNELHSL